MTDFNEGALNPNMHKLAQARKELDERANSPDGYIEVKLSTRGLIGAPAKFYIRNFSPEDLMTLGLANREDIPIKLIRILDNLIWNPHKDPQLSVANFHQKEVVELLLELYEVFYTTIFTNQLWTPIEEDWEFLAKQSGGRDTDEFRSKERALRNKTWRPTFDIDISQLDYHEIPDDVKTKARVERTIDGKRFTCTFTLPKFGDFLTLKYFIDSIYGEEDLKFSRISEMVKIKNEMKQRIHRGENVNLNHLPNIPKKDFERFREYENEKRIFSITASKALYLAEIDGKDVSKLPLEQKIELARDPRLDFTTFSMVQEHLNKLKFGLKEEITVNDPIINKVVTRKYSFRLNNILTAIRNTRISETNISFV